MSSWSPFCDFDPKMLEAAFFLRRDNSPIRPIRLRWFMNVGLLMLLFSRFSTKSFCFQGAADVILARERVTNARASVKFRNEIFILGGFEALWGRIYLRFFKFVTFIRRL